METIIEGYESFANACPLCKGNLQLYHKYSYAAVWGVQLWSNGQTNFFECGSCNKQFAADAIRRQQAIQREMVTLDNGTRVTATSFPRGQNFQFIVKEVSLRDALPNERDSELMVNSLVSIICLFEKTGQHPLNLGLIEHFTKLIFRG